MRKEETISVRVPSQVYKLFRARAVREHRTMSSLARNIIANYLEENPPGLITENDWAIYGVKE